MRYASIQSALDDGDGTLTVNYKKSGNITITKKTNRLEVMSDQANAATVTITAATDETQDYYALTENYLFTYKANVQKPTLSKLE